jgi:hypothetical protein
MNARSDKSRLGSQRSNEACDLENEPTFSNDGNPERRIYAFFWRLPDPSTEAKFSHGRTALR